MSERPSVTTFECDWRDEHDETCGETLDVTHADIVASVLAHPSAWTWHETPDGAAIRTHSFAETDGPQGEADLLPGPRNCVSQQPWLGWLGGLRTAPEVVAQLLSNARFR